MTMSCRLRERVRRRRVLAALFAFGLVASQVIVACAFSPPAFAKGNGNGNGGGNGNGNGGGGNGKGGGNKGGPNAHANPGAAGVQSPNAALVLREAGEIRPLGDLYRAAQQQFGGEIIDAQLVGNPRQGWEYDLRIVMDDGRVLNARYDAATLALRSLDGEPLE